MTAEYAAAATRPRMPGTGGRAGSDDFGDEAAWRCDEVGRSAGGIGQSIFDADTRGGGGGNDLGMPTILLIALGGALGSVARHLLTNVMQSPMPGAFPWGTLCVNVAGCLVIGVVAAAVGSGWNVRPELKLALTAGVLGGFTTFSSFGVQTLELWLAGKQAQAGAYVLASNVLGLGAVALGYAGVKVMAG